MKDILNSHSVSTLKKEISKTNIKGYSKMKKNEIVNPFINSLKKWIPSRVGSVGIVFIAAPLISFKLLYFIGLIGVTIRFLWLLRSYFKH